nr:hypothetical protein [Tanacetum cinerariifolium]
MDSSRLLIFLNANQIKYALTVSPTIYTSCIKIFWTTVKIKTVNDDVRLQTLIDGKKVVINKACISHDLKLNDVESTSYLTNVVIFEELARIGYEKPYEKLTFYKAFFSPQWKFFIYTILQCISPKTTSRNEFNITMASIIICLANNQKFNFSKYILDNLKKNLEAGVPFYMFPRFIQVLDLENEVIEMKSSHKAKIAELESRVEKLEEKNMSLTNELKCFNTTVEFLAIKENVMDKEESSKQGRKIVDIDVDVEGNLENVYNLDMTHEETALSMQDVTDADVKEVAKEMVEIAIDEEVARKIEAKWNGDIKDNIDWNKVVKQVQRRQSDTDNPEKQKLEEQQDSKKLKTNLEIVLDYEDDVFMNVIPFMEVLWKIVKDRFKKSQPKKVLDVFLWHTLKVMFEHTIEDNVWKLQKGLASMKNWKIFDSCRVHYVTLDTKQLFLLDEKMYPLTNYTLQKMFNEVILQADYEVEMAIDL